MRRLKESQAVPALNEVVLATHNIHKGVEMSALLRDVGITVRTLAEFPHAPEVEEDGKTCEANAIKKAITIARYTGLIAVADDTGLSVDALGGQPGVHAARYAGDGASYEDNCRKLLAALAGVEHDRRTARFETVAVVAAPSGDMVGVAHGVLEGTITQTPAGSQGFGYDPVFVISNGAKTLAELSLEEKNRMSHRARAFAGIKDILRRHITSLQVGA